MRRNIQKKIFCIFFILSLFLGGFYTGVSQAVAWADDFAALSESSADTAPQYSASSIRSQGKALPIQQYFSLKASGSTETMMASGQRNLKPAVRAAKNSPVNPYLVPNYSNAPSGVQSSLLLEASGSTLSSIFIIDYIHLQDGQKPIFCC